jgi:hypothetical protein
MPLIFTLTAIAGHVLALAYLYLQTPHDLGHQRPDVNWRVGAAVSVHNGANK